jgi:exopolysaccharide production protein ExoQ
MERSGNRSGTVGGIELAATSDRFGEYASILAKASLVIFLLFLFFGTTLPFQERIEKFDDPATEDPVKQVVLSSLYIVSFLSLLPRKSQAIDLIKKEKFLGVFLLWSLLTVAWSEYPFMSFKRWLQTAGVVMILVSALLHIESEDRVWNYVRSILIVYLPLSLLSVLLIPGAIDPDGTAWKGFTSQKNVLGQVSLLSLIIWTSATFKNGAWHKIFGLLLIGLSAALLVGSRSTTAVLTSGILLILVSVLYARNKLFSPIIGEFFSWMLVLSFFASLILLSFLEPSVMQSLFGIFGKDTGFTGRTEIWSNMMDEIKKHWVFGCGFQGFWMTPKSSLEVFLYDLQWPVNHAHQGYLDLLNETGLVGLSIFLMMMIQYFKNLLPRWKSSYLSTVVVGVLILEFMETTLFRSDSVCGCLFLLSYLSLYAYPPREVSAPVSLLFDDIPQGERRKDTSVAFLFLQETGLSRGGEGLFPSVDFHRMISAQPRNGLAHVG